MSHPILAVHVTAQHGLRAVVTQNHQVMRQRIEDCFAPAAWVPYLNEMAEQYPNLRLVVSPFDPWPSHLFRAVEETNLPIRWVPADFEREAYWAIKPWRSRRRLYRARFLAFLHEAFRRSIFHSGHDVGIQWERYLAMETIDDLDKAVNGSTIAF